MTSSRLGMWDKKRQNEERHGGGNVWEEAHQRKARKMEDTEECSKRLRTTTTTAERKNKANWERIPRRVGGGPQRQFLSRNVTSRAEPS